MAHNGDLAGYAPRLHGAFRPVGDTDSELALCWLMQELAKAHASVPAVEELTLTLGELVPCIAPRRTVAAGGRLSRTTAAGPRQAQVRVTAAAPPTGPCHSCAHRRRRPARAAARRRRGDAAPVPP